MVNLPAIALGNPEVFGSGCSFLGARQQYGLVPAPASSAARCSPATPFRSPSQDPQAPAPRSTCGGTLGHDHSLVQHLESEGVVHPQDFDFLETRGVVQCLSPHLAGVARAWCGR